MEASYLILAVAVIAIAVIISINAFIKAKNAKNEVINWLKSPEAVRLYRGETGGRGPQGERGPMGDKGLDGKDGHITEGTLTKERILELLSQVHGLNLSR
jgi:hypothetical protein